jgi:hypothetical protein
MVTKENQRFLLVYKVINDIVNYFYLENEKTFIRNILSGSPCITLIKFIYLLLPFVGTKRNHTRLPIC